MNSVNKKKKGLVSKVLEERKEIDFKEFAKQLVQAAETEDDNSTGNNYSTLAEINAISHISDSYVQGVNRHYKH